MKTNLLILVVALLTSMLQGQTHNWTGNGGDTNWFNPSNWDVNSVPDINSDVLIFNATVDLAASSGEANSIYLSDFSTLRLANDLTITDFFQLESPAIFIHESGTLSGGTVDNSGLIRFESQNTRTLDGVTIVNGGEFEINNTNQTILTNGTHIENRASGTIIIASVGGFLSQGTNGSLDNDGLIEKVQDGVNPNGNFYLILDVFNAGIISIAENETLLCLGGNITLENWLSGVIQGDGTFDITANFINTGTISPGSEGQTGTLNITNNLSMADPGNISVDIEDLTNYDQILVTGAPVLEGEFVVRAETLLDLDDEFTVVTSSMDMIECSFPQFVFSELWDNTFYEFEVICNPKLVVLRVNSIAFIGYDDFPANEVRLTLVPNPVSGSVQLVFPEAIINEFDVVALITDVTGKTVLTAPIESVNPVLDTSNLRSGMYMVELYGNGRVLGNSRMIKH